LTPSISRFCDNIASTVRSRLVWLRLMRFRF
jgi:hypothetical protein